MIEPAHRRATAAATRATNAAVRLVVARCSVVYTGRLGARLPEARRLIMLKDDGSLAIHADPKA